MHVQDAIMILQRLDRSTAEVIPIEPEGCPLVAVRSAAHPSGYMLDANGKPLVKYVNRIEYLRWIRTTHNLIKKQESLCHLQK